MKRILSGTLAFVMAASIGTLSLPTQENCKAAEKECRYIIMTENKSDLQEIKESCKEEKDSKLGTDYSENHMVCKLTKSEAITIAETNGVIVEEDKTIKACSSSIGGESSTDAEWNLQMIRADEENMETGTEKIRVAVLDSGVDNFNDLELAGSINLIPGEEEVLPLFWDVTGHGSSVAGIIAAKKNDVGITGIAPDVELYAAKVLDEKNQAPVSRVIEGIYWAIENNVNIINMSFGMRQNSEALHKAVKDAYDAGILLVAAAGNGNTIEFPAAYSEVVAVGSVDTSGTVSEESASGEELELAAPGEQICSTGAFEGTLIAGGTSMAAPHVTGVAAKLWAKDTTVSAEFIRQLLAVSANECGSAKKYGYGLVDFAYADEIYENFKANYVESAPMSENSSDIERNDSTVPEFDDVNYVEGRWTRDAHEKTIINSNLNITQINIIKSGAVYPDMATSTAKLGDHPYWHGGSKCSNYISSYIYATNMARAVKNGKALSTATKPAGLSATDSSAMLSAVNSFSWSNILATPSNANKALFIWGMAIHNATDVYAHSADGRINGVWQHLDHPSTKNYKNGLADRTDANAFPERYQTAVKVAKKSLETYVSNKSGNVSDFLPADAYKSAGITWSICKLFDNANCFSSKVANSLKPYSA